MRAQPWVDSVRAQAQRTDAALAALVEDGRPCCHVVTMRRVLHGSGPQETTVRLWYLEEENPADPVLPRQVLVKAEAVANIAARVFRITYWYRDGALARCVRRPDTATACGEQDLYFHNSRLAAAVTRGHGDDCGARPWTPAGDAQAWRRAERNARARAAEYLAAFHALLRVEEDAE
jgi:hypothetical protein